MNQCNENMPYIFISYSHRDSDLVLPIINRLSMEGYNLWYDAGIEAGSEWDENIARHIGKCSYFIAFVSKNYIASKNCKDELNYSRDLDKEQFLIYLEEVELPGGMAMRMNRIQAIYWNKYRQNNMEAAYQKIFTAVGIEKTRVFMPHMQVQQAQPVMPHVQPQQPQQAQPATNHIQGAGNAVSEKKEYVAFLKPALVICGILFVVFIVLAVVLGVVLIKKKSNQEMTSEVQINVDSNHPLYEYYERAADGDVDAISYLADIYYFGSEEISVNYEESLFWNEKLAENGDVNAMHNIATLYYYDQVVVADGYKRCVDWCTRIIEIEPNNAEAMHMMGNCYYWGMYGIEEDPEVAFMWWHKAASYGYLDSVYNVAWCYENGYGVQPNYDKAQEWYQILIDADYEF